MGCVCTISHVWEKGGEGGKELAQAVLDAVEAPKEQAFHMLYPEELSLEEKIETIAREIYHAKHVNYTTAAKNALKRISQLGYGNLPVCMAKTQYSFSDDAKKLGSPEGFEIQVREAYVSSGAGFVVVITGNIMTMPGLPKKPAAEGIDVNQQGRIVGLF
jgi:formate--tetrahydrofolate ligase